MRKNTEHYSEHLINSENAALDYINETMTQVDKNKRTMCICAGGLNPTELFGTAVLTSPKGIIVLLVGGILVGFGARYAGGCTSGHAISGLSNLQVPSLIAVIGFFIGGLITTHVLLPLMF